MKHWLKKILYRNRALVNGLLRLFVRLHNYSYKKITEYASLLNHGVNPKFEITRYAEFFLRQISKGDSVLDIGCGSGLLAAALAPKAGRIVGIDISASNIDSAKKRFQLPNLELVVGDATSHHFSGRFDKLILSNVLEHIENRPALLKKITALGDTLLLRVPMITRDWLSVYKSDKGLPYKLDQTHFTEYTLEQIQSEADLGGWRIESYQVNWGEFWGVLKKK